MITMKDKAMTVRIRLVGCENYNYKGELFKKGYAYKLTRLKAENLLRKRNEHSGMPYFAVVKETVKVKPKVEPEDIIEEVLQEVDATRTDEKQDMGEDDSDEPKAEVEGKLDEELDDFDGSEEEEDQDGFGGVDVDETISNIGNP